LLAVNVMLSPTQTTSLVAEIVGVEPGTTISVNGLDTLLEHSPILQTNVYVPEIVGTKVMLEPVNPFDHKRVPALQPVAVSVAG
jgi:hypothetical protein